MSKEDDAGVDWSRTTFEGSRRIDAAVILSDDGPGYPSLLGTGGNDGRLDHTDNFMQRLVEISEIATDSPRLAASKGLDSALFGTPACSLSRSAIGQFDPGAAWVPNASAGFEGRSLRCIWVGSGSSAKRSLFWPNTWRWNHASRCFVTVPLTMLQRTDLVAQRRDSLGL